MSQYTAAHVAHELLRCINLRYGQGWCHDTPHDPQVSELEWRQRVRITSMANEQATFEFTLRQRLGGLYDGIFYTQALRAEDPSESALL